MKTVQIIFPHQLFENTTHLNIDIQVYLVEEYLFFKQYKFHKQKIAFHRASMKCYEQYLTNNGFNVTYVTSSDEISDIRLLIGYLATQDIDTILFMNPTDNWLEKRISSASLKFGLEVNYSENLLFINTKDKLTSFFKPSKKKFFQTSFYKNERKRMNILVDRDENPFGGKWTFDAENRKKYPKGKTPPSIHFPETTHYHREAKTYVEQHFSTNYGQLTDFTIYPIDFAGAKAWFRQFLEHRFHEFGTYEDAIVQKETFLHHSLLSPLMNVGLLTPQFVVKESLLFAEENNIPINSVEGFIRQIIGWREFIRGVYEVKGTEERTRNFWEHKRKIPSSLYDGTTGIPPIDDTIKKVLKTGYCHHIERLMILGNMMVLCEFHPDEVYEWFMELFIDAYDWVMVPNIYGMSLFADGGLMSTKPYISSSNYILKMSDYSKGEWQKIWDGLFWRFMDKHKDFFLSNPRLSMLVRNLDKMKDDVKTNHLKTAEHFLNQLV